MKWALIVVYLIGAFFTYGYLHNNFRVYKDCGYCVLGAVVWPVFWPGYALSFPIRWAAGIAVEATRWTKPDPCSKRFICKSAD